MRRISRCTLWGVGHVGTSLRKEDVDNKEECRGRTPSLRGIANEVEASPPRKRPFASNCIKVLFSIQNRCYICI